MLVLHAEDDPKIPVSLAKALVQAVRQGGKGDISMEVAPASLGYAHNQVLPCCFCFFWTFVSRFLDWKALAMKFTSIVTKSSCPPVFSEIHPKKQTAMVIGHFS